MKEVAIYLLEVAACSGVLLGTYALLLERRVGFRWCRRYLLAATVAAAVIPRLRIPVWPAETVTVTTAAAFAPTEIPAGFVAEGAVAASVAPERIALGIYLAGAALLLGTMLWQLLRIRRLRRGAEIRREGRFTLVLTGKPIASFSWFQSIYIDGQTPPHELAAIVAHERSHIRHRHSVERLCMECLKAAMWWNPFVWILARRLTEAQEFEADSDALESGFELTEYTSILFKQLFGYVPEIASGLRDSLTKKRLQMMTSAKRSRYALLRLAGTLPALIGLLCAFSFTSRAAAIRTQDATNSLHTVTPAPGQPAEKGRVTLSFLARFPKGLFETEVRHVDAKLRAIATGKEINVDKKGTVVLEAAPGTVYEITSPGYEPVLYTVKKGEAAGIIMLQPVRAEKSEPVVYVRDEYGVKQRPLYIVDGEERPNEMEGIDVSHVADMKILKGDEAVAKYGEMARYGAFVVTTTDGRAPSADATDASGSASETVGTTGDTDDEVYLSAETMPRFRGGELNEYVQWVAEQIILPEGVAPKGRAAASFVVGKEGTIRDIRILASPDQRLSKEIIRVLDASSGMWTPGMQDGKRVSVRYTIPVRLDSASEDEHEAPPTPASGTEDETQPDAGKKIPMLVEQMPAFEGGGIVAFRQWVLTNLRYPEAALKKSVRGKVIVSFVVEPDGSVAQAQILQTPDRVLGDEVLRVVKKSPRWEPGREKGEAVAVELMLPVVFNISDGTPPAVPAGKSTDPGSIAPIVVTAFPTEE